VEEIARTTTTEVAAVVAEIMEAKVMTETTAVVVAEAGTVIARMIAMMVVTMGAVTTVDLTGVG